MLISRGFVPLSFWFINNNSFNNKRIWEGTPMKFLEKIILKNMKDAEDFKNLCTEEKKMYITLYGHDYFSQILTEMLVHRKTLNLVFYLAILIGIVNVVVKLVLETNILFYISCPIMTLLIFWEYNIGLRWKLDETKYEEWHNKTSEKIQNLLFKDYKFFSISKRSYVCKIDKEFYKRIQTEKCLGECYSASFKLAWLLNNPNVKIIWMSATYVVTKEKYGHAVLEENGRIFDTNTRRSYPRDVYLEVQKVEIFKEYHRNEYRKVVSPFDLPWEEFGKWCEERGVERCK